MTDGVSTGAARASAGLELARMLAALLWVLGATVATVLALGAVPRWLTGDRGVVRHVATIQDAERRLAARVLVPGYFPERLEWPPREIRIAGGRRGSVRLDLVARDGGPDLHILESTRDGEPIAPELLEARTVLRSSRATVMSRPATLSDVLVEGKPYRELSWSVGGWQVMLRSAGDVDELFHMARTLHREGGR